MFPYMYIFCVVTDYNAPTSSQAGSCSTDNKFPHFYGTQRFITVGSRCSVSSNHLSPHSPRVRQLSLLVFLMFLYLHLDRNTNYATCHTLSVSDPTARCHMLPSLLSAALKFFLHLHIAHYTDYVTTSTNNVKINQNLPSSRGHVRIVSPLFRKGFQPTDS